VTVSTDGLRTGGTCRMLTAVLPGVRRTAAAVTAGGAHQRSRPPKAAAAAESETLPRLQTSDPKAERGAASRQGPARAFLRGPVGAHGKERRCGRAPDGASGDHRAREAVRARHVSARNPGPASHISLCGRRRPSTQSRHVSPGQ